VARGCKQLDIERVRSLLDTQVLGSGDRLVFLPVVASTNTLAMKLALDGSEEGVVVLTDNQTAGRGRQGRPWIDRAGCNALSSSVLHPLFPPHLLVMLASLAVVAAAAETCGVAATIKWPNDVLIAERKVAGILIETSHTRTGRLAAVVGIGVNVNGQIQQFTAGMPASQQAERGIAATATTLEEANGHVVDREAFIANLLRHLEHQYLALQQEAQDPTTQGDGPISRLIREQWRGQLSILGRTIQVHQGNTLLSGVAEDVNENGELLLRTHSGERISITWGDVT